MNKYLVALFLIALSLPCFGESHTPDAIIFGEVVSEVTGGLRTMKYQMVRVRKVHFNKTTYSLKENDSVIVARPYNVSEITPGLVKVRLRRQDGAIQKDAWYLIDYRRD
jgi:hypothetical protein